jgi:hypothetical protein
MIRPRTLRRHCLSKEMAMKTFVGVSFAAAVTALFAMATIDRATAASHVTGIGAASVTTMTDVSAARRSHRVHRVHRAHRHRHHRPRVYVRGPYRPYYERPYYYVPQGPATFFPFSSGYGLDPSW